MSFTRSKTPSHQKVAPVKWFVNRHVFKGRERLNILNWKTLSKAEKADALDEINEVITEKGMPLKSYTLLHSEAKLSDTDREIIIN